MKSTISTPTNSIPLTTDAAQLSAATLSSPSFPLASIPIFRQRSAPLASPHFSQITQQQHSTPQERRAHVNELLRQALLLVADDIDDALDEINGYFTTVLSEDPSSEDADKET
eukprot:scaffold7007_cov146-Amphora_coffeaeformis.AAC.8